MADPPRQSGVDADEYGNGPRARHLRIDDRPAVRDLDDAQLAAEALTALRAEHQPPEPEQAGILPWDPPSRSIAAAAAPVSASGRHRAGAGPVAFAPVPQAAVRGRPPGAPTAGSAHPAPSRDDHVLVTARAGLRPPGAPEAATRRSWRARPLLIGVAVAILVGLGALVFVLVRPTGDAGPSDGGPAVSVGPPASTADASPPVAPTTASTGNAAAPASVSAAANESATSGTGSPTPADTDAERTVPAPAVLSTLAPGDAGFGWPTTAFGRPR